MITNLVTVVPLIGEDLLYSFKAVLREYPDLGVPEG